MASDRQLVPSAARPVPGSPDRVEVGVHVRAPEPVDRLLGVADDHEGRVGAVATEQRAEDLPLHGVGVLELVDQRDTEATPHRVDRARIRRRR